MSDLPSYSDYKESGVEWLGEIPSHWLLIKNKFILNFSKGLTITKENLIDEGIPCVNYGEVHSKFGFEVDPNKHSLKCVPEIYLNDFPNALLKKGDFIFADTSEDIKGSGNFTYLNSELPTFAGYHTIIAKINNINYPRYLAYVFDCDSYRNQIRAQVKGIKVFSITQFMLKNSIVWLPPLEEQKAITRYLDKKLAQIDTLITKQQALLEKLAEQRIALISNAVTKGLNPDVEMKESEVEWLGGIPSHWVQMSLKYSLAIPITDGPHETPEILTEGVPFISAEAVKNDKLDFHKKRGYISEEDDLKFSKKYKPKYGDVYMVKSGATTGNVARVETYERFNIWSPLAVMRPNQKHITTDYLFYTLKSEYFNNFVKTKWNMGTQQNIGMGILANIPTIIPPLEEQQAIANYLDNKMNQIERVELSHIECINRLKEYRSALITQAVTGKIDVRNLAN